MYWTANDVAEFLGVRLCTVKNYRQSGFMPAPVERINRFAFLWNAAEVIAWQASRPQLGRGSGRKRRPALCLEEEL